VFWARQEQLASKSDCIRNIAESATQAKDRMNPNVPTPPESTTPTQPQAAQVAPPKFRFALALLVLGVAAIVSTLVTMVMPESFCSSARIKVLPDRTDIPGLSEQPPFLTRDPLFMQTELEVIQSELVLGRAVEDLQLNSKWGRKYLGTTLKTTESLRILKERLDLHPVRNTSLIDILAYSEDRDEAAQLANSIATAYQEYRLETRRRLILDGLRVLTEAFNENQSRLRLLEDRKAALARASSPEKSQSSDEIQRQYNEARGVEEALNRRIANANLDARLPANQMVKLVERAVPGLKPVRPNLPFNIWAGTLIGGFVGLVLTTLVYLLQRRDFLRKSGAGVPPMLRRFRIILHVIVGLVVASAIGYLCTDLWSLGSLYFILLFLVVGVLASTFIELANISLSGPSNVQAPSKFVEFTRPD